MEDLVSMLATASILIGFWLVMHGVAAKLDERLQHAGRGSTTDDE